MRTAVEKRVHKHTIYWIHIAGALFCGRTAQCSPLLFTVTANAAETHQRKTKKRTHTNGGGKYGSCLCVR